MQTETETQPGEGMADLICDACQADIPGGEVVVLEGNLLCVSCAWNRASLTLEPLLSACWTPADIRASKREYEEAMLVLLTLAARINARLSERV